MGNDMPESQITENPALPAGRRPWRFWDTIAAAVWLVLLGFIYAGFFSTDPRSGSMVKVLIWAVRLVLPLLGIGLLWLYYALRTGRVPLSALALLCGSVILVMLLAYPVVSSIYYGCSFRQNINEYHPFLQLAPRSYQPRDNDPSQTYRIFCLGGSTTEFTDKNRRGWPDRLEERLRRDSADRSIEVHNLGRQWYTTEHTLINYAVNLRQHRPNAVIVMHAINDLLVNADFCYYSFGKFAYDYRHFHGAVYRLIKRPTLWETIVSVFGKMWYFKGREIIRTAEFPGLLPFAQNLRTLIALARADSVQVILLTQPYLFKETMTPEEDAALIMLHVEAVGPDKEWDLWTALQGMRKYNDTVRQIAGEEHVPLIDLEQAIPKTLEYLSDDVHYREKTFDVIAGFLAGELRKIGIPPTVAGTP